MSSSHEETEETIEQKVGKGIDGAVNTAKEVGVEAKDLVHRASEKVKEAARKAGEKVEEAGRKIKDAAKKA